MTCVFFPYATVEYFAPFWICPNMLVFCLHKVKKENAGKICHLTMGAKCHWVKIKQGRIFPCIQYIYFLYVSWIRSAKQFNQAALNRKRKLASAAAPKELRLHDFIHKKKPKSTPPVNLRVGKAVSHQW